jgi:predicted dehydrogenase
MIQFTRTIQDDSEAAPSLRDGRAALEIGLAAFKSTETKKPVKVAG